MTSNKKTLLMLLLVLAGMITLTAFSATLYSMFCKLTGFGGTTQVAVQLPAETVDRTMTVTFSTNVDPALPWSFHAETKTVVVKLGEAGRAKFIVTNNSDRPITGVAIYNVAPDKAGIYFQKVQCFCFTKHTLKPGETQEFPILFFIDPTLADDPNLAEVQALTLHYTYFEAKE